MGAKRTEVSYTHAHVLLSDHINRWLCKIKSLLHMFFINLVHILLIFAITTAIANSSRLLLDRMHNRMLWRQLTKVCCECVVARVAEKLHLVVRYHQVRRGNTPGKDALFLHLSGRLRST